MLAMHALLFFHGGNKQKHICLILDNKAFILGMIHKNGERIIGLAVDVDYQNNGIGGSLLKAFESIALQHGKQKCYIRTFDGIQFFEKHGYNVIDIAKNGKDLILEKWIK